jgi:thymidylate synthase
MKAILVDEINLTSAWEKAVQTCFEQGIKIKTQYDRPDDPPSSDCTMLIRVEQPFLEPRYHRGICMGLNDLEKYVQEVIYGVHDHWMHDLSNPNRWTYTYHERIFNYRCLCGHGPLNQFSEVVSKLKDCHYTRRAQIVTWKVWTDNDHDDPPCLQSCLFRILDNKLHMNVRFRSNDLFKAAFPNMLALTELQKMMAEEVGVEVGEYLHLSDSMHIYGKDNIEVTGFLSLLAKRNFHDRTWPTNRVAPYFLDGCNELLNETGMPLEKLPLIEARKSQWQKMM